MEVLKFKTNVNCENCIKKVTPKLNENLDILSWKVDTDNPDKIMTVEVDGVSAQEIIDSLKEIGYSAEQID